MNVTTLVDILVEQRDGHVDGSVYKAVQCDLAYSSNRIEGSRLSHDQTVMIFDGHDFSGTAPVDDIVEMANHFRLFDRMLDHVGQEIDGAYLCELHGILKRGTRQDADPRFSVGSFKRFENIIDGGIGGTRTCPPEEVPRRIGTLLATFAALDDVGVPDLARFHASFEAIHPFSDGNGRVGRLVMFEQALSSAVVPFIVSDDLRPFYIRGLREWDKDKAFLTDTLLTAQDRFTASYVPLAESYDRVSRRDGRDRHIPPTDETLVALDDADARQAQVTEKRGGQRKR